MMMLPFFSRRKGEGIDTKDIQKAYNNGEQISSAIENGICTFFEHSKRA